MSMEIDRLAQGNDYGVTPTDTIGFIPYAFVPTGTKVIYTSFVADYRLLNLNPTASDVWLVAINWITRVMVVLPLQTLPKPRSSSTVLSLMQTKQFSELTDL